MWKLPGCASYARQKTEVASCAETGSKLLPTLTCHSAGSSQVFWPGDVLRRLKVVTTRVTVYFGRMGESSHDSVRWRQQKEIFQGKL